MNYQSDKRNQEPLNDRLREEADEAKDQLKLAKHKGEEILEEAKDKTKKYAKETTSALRDCIEKNPLAAVSIATLIGIGLALLLTK